MTVEEDGECKLTELSMALKCLKGRKGMTKKVWKGEAKTATVVVLEELRMTPCD